MGKERSALFLMEVSGGEWRGMEGNGKVGIILSGGERIGREGTGVDRSG